MPLVQIRLPAHRNAPSTLVLKTLDTKVDFEESVKQIMDFTF
jgi:hypothetical protein